MSSADTTLNVNDSLGYYWSTYSGNTETQYIYMYFAEVVKHQPNQSREFNIFLNGKLWYGPLVPDYLSTTTIQSTIGEIGQQFQLWINKTETSTLQPILNAFEIYTLKQLLQAQTHQEDGMFLPHKKCTATCLISIYPNLAAITIPIICFCFKLLSYFFSFYTYEIIS